MIVIITNKKRLKAYAIFTLMVLVLAGGFARGFNKRSIAVTGNGEIKGYLSIVIDDFGNNSKGTKEMLELPIKFTGAVMPSMPYTKDECKMLNDAGKDIILHMPMEAHTGKKSWLGETPIMDNYSNEQVEEIFIRCINETDGLVGVNNHMGSKVTENERIFNILMKIMKEKNLIFVDSLTSPKSVVENTAKTNNVYYLKRDVFLDSTQDLYKIKKNMLKAAKIASENGYAIAIGHVGAEGGIVTAQAIRETMDEIRKMNIEFVGVSDLIKICKP